MNGNKKRTNKSPALMHITDGDCKILYRCLRTILTGNVEIIDGKVEITEVKVEDWKELLNWAYFIIAWFNADRLVLVTVMLVT